mmetsp:Transcript_25920/g.62242  ORF Transcript_25920/g.62242 Transcript_25920/m.62242 type:complete len:559 (+) Transcript_25920:104-1780(+)
MPNIKQRCRRRGYGAAASSRPRLASCLLLLAFVLLCTHHAAPIVSAGVFGQKRQKAEKEDVVAAASSQDETAKESSEAPETTVSQTEHEVETKTDEPIENNMSSSETSPSPPSRPPTIIEAEARTARELSRAVNKLTKDLNTCNVRVDAIEEGFQNLYSAHLGNVDGLRKCKEGVLTPAEMDKLDSGLDGVNPALVEQARAKEDERRRSDQQEFLSRRQREAIKELEDEVEKLVRRERTWERTISELVARRDLLERREGAWERTIGDLMGEIEIRAKRESWWEEMKMEMEGRIGALSQVAAIERFGPGPHHVSITVLLDEGNPSSQRDIVLELAPLDVMPHSVHLFLSQIDAGYWTRGTPAIAINAEHVLQACPHPCLENVDDPYEDMRRAGLDAVSFQEYSTYYPHVEYTVGFAGRPHSGPEFYINVMDNTADHGTLEERKFKMGPTRYKAWAEEVFGGSEEVEEKSIEPYPCFGKVIRGFDVVDEIAKGMTRASLPREEEGELDDTAFSLDDNMLLRPVRIASVKFLKDYNPDANDKERKETGQEERQKGLEEDEL